MRYEKPSMVVNVLDVHEVVCASLTGNQTGLGLNVSGSDNDGGWAE